MAGRFRQARCACRTSAEALAARQPMMPEQVKAGMAEVWARMETEAGLRLRQACRTKSGRAKALSGR
jgi:hypothetical protein